MTNKKIIVDGVDVSECDFVFIGKDKKAKIACWCNKLNLICKDNPNCYYKQQKRKEQKLAKIKEIVMTHKEQRCKTCTYYDDCFDCDDVLLQILEGKENG